MLFVFVCMPVHAYGKSGRCWTAIVMNFNVYLATLPTGGWYRLLAGCNCKDREAWNRQQYPGTEAQNHDKGRCGETVTGVHRSVMKIQNKRVTGGMEKRVGTEA